MDFKAKQKIIVVTGVESTGKSTLAKSLANKLEVAYVPEYARQYLENRKGVYEYSDLEEIAKLQLTAIENTSSEFVIIDTAFLVLKIWSEEKFGKCSRFILNELAVFKPAAYLLCALDVPWENDVLREHPMEEDRKRLFQIYLSHLQEQSAPFAIMTGTKKERLKKAALYLSKF